MVLRGLLRRARLGSRFARQYFHNTVEYDPNSGTASPDPARAATVLAEVKVGAIVMLSSNAAGMPMRSRKTFRADSAESIGNGETKGLAITPGRLSAGRGAPAALASPA